jgi:hypothetical protein
MFPAVPPACLSNRHAGGALQGSGILQQQDCDAGKRCDQTGESRDQRRYLVQVSCPLGSHCCTVRTTRKSIAMQCFYGRAGLLLAQGVLL